MKRIFEALGIDSSFYSRMFKCSQSALDQRFLRANEVRLRLWGDAAKPLLCRMDYAGSFKVNRDEAYTELASSLDTVCRAPGSAVPLQNAPVAIGAQGWSAIPCHEQEYITESGSIIELLHLLFPVWVANVNRIPEVLEPFRICALDRESDLFLRDTIAGDFDKLMKEHPTEIGQWNF